MKAILEFSLPDERVEHRWAIESGSYACVIQNFGEFLRKIRKHEELTEDGKQMLDRIRDRWIVDTTELVGLDE